jgi:hypothetical protein
MSKDPAVLRKRFLKHVLKYWIMNDHALKDIPCVYIILGLDFMNRKRDDIFYVGSTTKLFSRYKSHKVPIKIQKEGLSNLLFFIPMNKGFYDYEIKLIRKLKPKFNYQHKNG